jgi:hypothetical protein
MNYSFPRRSFIAFGTVGIVLAALAIWLLIAATTSAFAATPVAVCNLQPDFTSAGGGGVFSGYYGPPAYNAVSPGTTAVYTGRQAAPIYAGLTIDPTDLVYEDQGLFAFKPGNTPVATFAAQPLNWDVLNQYGTNPVWVYIELNKGLTGDIIYQYVPTSNPASWHTEDAATGTHWQAWTDLSSGIPTGPMLSLAGIAAANPGKTVDRVYLTEGMGNSYHAGVNGTVAWVNQVTIGAVTYDFVVSCTPAPTPTPNAVGGLVDVVTGGSGSGGSMGLSWLLAGLVAITAVSGGGLWTLLRRRS